jgi:hypothetical protein
VTIVELTDELLRLIDFEKSEIIQPKKLVFICGGKASGITNSPASMRELLLTYAASNGGVGKFGDANILLAEEAMIALAKSNFGNLLDLEEYIAAIVDAVLLIVESPGSMCELGAFVKTQEIREKLIVVMPSDYINVPSFITKGAISFLEENHPTAQVLGFHWSTGSDFIVSAADYVLSQMNEDIPAAMTAVHSAHKKELFKSTKIGHIIHLTLAFCHLLRAARLSDLKKCFSTSNIEIDETTIKRCLDTLTISKLVKVVTVGKTPYYVAQVDRMPLEIRWKRETPNKDRNTLRWIARIAKSIEQEDKLRLDIFREHYHA